MRSIAVINQKGGVGKTTTTVNLGAGLARRGYRVLLLDMDPQANLTVHVDKRPDLESGTLTSLMLEDEQLADIIQTTAQPGLFVVPADTSLAGVEQVLANRIGRETILREALESLEEKVGSDAFDVVLLDCPPSLGVLSANALVAAQFVLIPMQAQYLSLQGMAKLMEVIQLVQKRLNPQLEIARVLPCMVDSRTNLSAEVLAEIEHHFGPLLATTRIRNNVKLAEAPSFGRTIYEHAPDSNGAADYDTFAAEFLTAMELPVRDVVEVQEETEDENAAESPADPEPSEAESTIAESAESAAVQPQPTPEAETSEAEASEPVARPAAQSGDDTDGPQQVGAGA